MFIRAANINDVHFGGMVEVRLEGKDIVLCNVSGDFYAIGRRCGHENAPLNRGTLNGFIVTCPLHYAQFDVRTGEALLGPGNQNYGKGDVTLYQAGNTRDLHSYPVQVKGSDVYVDPDS